MREQLKSNGTLDIFSRTIGGTWEFVRTEKNLIVNTGYNALANRLTGQSTYASTTFQYFAWGDGTTAPALTDTAADFYADCANSDSKAVLSIDAFDVPTHTQRWNCFLSSTDNAVVSIKKFALMNADPGTVMFNELLFSSPLSKDSYQEFYFRYNLALSQV